jgi:hypothetical protein
MFAPPDEVNCASRGALKKVAEAGAVLKVSVLLRGIEKTGRSRPGASTVMVALAWAQTKNADENANAANVFRMTPPSQGLRSVQFKGLI